MLSLILFLIIVICVCLWGAWQMDITAIEQEMKAQHSYVVGLTSRQYAERVLWVRTEKAFNDFLKGLKGWFKRYKIQGYWNCIMMDKWYVLPCFSVTIETTYSGITGPKSRFVLGIELSWFNRWYAVELYYRFKTKELNPKVVQS